MNKRVLLHIKTSVFDKMMIENTEIMISKCSMWVYIKDMIE